MQIDKHERPLSAPLRLSFDYTRSVGPLLSQFFTALRERRILGVRGSDGRVHVPPAEFDPVTYDRLTEIVPVASVGTVVSWTWQSTPLEGQPLDRPFAWALIKLDGADTPLLHAVDAVTSDAISTGARVHAHWVDEPVGAITDIACFALGDQAEPEGEPDDREPVKVQVVPSAIEIQHTASLPETKFLRALEEGKLLAARTRRGRGEKAGPVWRPTCCSTAQTSRSCTWSPRSIRRMCEWACGWKPCGSPARSGASASTTSTTSGRRASPMPTTTPTSTTCKGL